MFGGDRGNIALEGRGETVFCIMSILPKSLIFEIKHCLMDLYKVCSNGGPGI